MMRPSGHREWSTVTPQSTAHGRSRRALVAGAAGGLGAAWLAACGGGSASDGAGQSAAAGTIDVLYLSGSGVLADARAAAMVRFMAAVPGVKVNPIPWAPAVEVVAKFKTMSAAGTPPDVTSFTTTDMGDFVADHLLASLDGLIKTRGRGFSRDAFYPEVLGAMTVDGKLYAVPRFAQTMLLYHNKDLFARSGLSLPTEDWTWDTDFIAAAQRIRTAQTDEPTFAIQWDGGASPNKNLRNSILFAWGAELVDKTGKKCLLNDAKALAALEYLYDLRWKNGYAAPSTTQVAWNTGRMATIPNGSFAYDGYRALQFQTGVALMPKGPGGRRQYGVLDAWGMAEGSKQKEAAWEFLKWIVGDEAQQHLANTETTTPATKKVYLSPNVPPELSRLFSEALKTAAYMPTVRHFPDVLAAINAELGASLEENTRSVRDSATAATTAVDRLLAS
jgi:multiple sugar transport system substrate-binding protein